MAWQEKTGKKRRECRYQLEKKYATVRRQARKYYTARGFNAFNFKTHQGEL